MKEKLSPTALTFTWIGSDFMLSFVRSSIVLVAGGTGTFAEVVFLNCIVPENNKFNSSTLQKISF